MSAAADRGAQEAGEPSGRICRPLRRGGRAGDENGALGKQGGGLSGRGSSSARDAFAQRVRVYVTPQVYYRDITEASHLVYAVEIEARAEGAGAGKPALV